MGPSSGRQQPLTVGVLGAAGAVGSATAYSLALSPAVGELILFDRTQGLAEVQVMDLEQVCARLENGGTVRAGAVEDALGADVAILAVSTHPREGMSHEDFLVPNARIVRDLVAQGRSAGTGPKRLLVASAPVEPLTTYLRRELEMGREAVLGYTLNDTSRLRVAIARAIDVDPDRVTAWSLGELGAHRVPLLSRVQVDGEPRELDSGAREQVSSYLGGWFGEWMKRAPTRTSAWMTGHGLSLVLSAMTSADSGEWPLAVVLAGEYGMSDVALTVPARLSPSFEVAEWKLEETEAELLREAGKAVKTATARIYDEVGGLAG